MDYNFLSFPKFPEISSGIRNEMKFAQFKSNVEEFFQPIQRRYIFTNELIPIEFNTNWIKIPLNNKQYHNYIIHYDINYLFTQISKGNFEFRVLTNGQINKGALKITKKDFKIFTDYRNKYEVNRKE